MTCSQNACCKAPSRSCTSCFFTREVFFLAFWFLVAPLLVQCSTRSAPSHTGLAGNEMADRLASSAPMNTTIKMDKQDIMKALTNTLVHDEAEQEKITVSRLMETEGKWQDQSFARNRKKICESVQHRNNQQTDSSVDLESGTGAPLAVPRVPGCCSRDEVTKLLGVLAAKFEACFKQKQPGMIPHLSYEPVYFV